MSHSTMPHNLVSAGAIPSAWIARLPGFIDETTAHWRLRVGEPYQPGGVTSWVAPAVDAGGRDVVLKITYPDVESKHEYAGLRVWDGDGTVRLYDEFVDERHTALLLERCTPGTTLEEAAGDVEQDEILAGLLRRLWRHSPDGFEFRPLQDMCDYWADEVDSDLAEDPAQLDAGITRAGMELFRGLSSSAQSQVLLVTDLHAGNIVSAEREPWLMIDPKPYVGDPHYDALQHLLNNPDRLADDPLGWAEPMAGLLDLDYERLRLWLFARCVQESVDQPYMRDVARAIAP